MGFDKTIGSRAEVFHGTAEKTTWGKEGLKKKDLFRGRKDGRIKSRKASKATKKSLKDKDHGFRAYRTEAKKTKGKKFKEMM